MSTEMKGLAVALVVGLIILFIALITRKGGDE